MNPIKTVQKRQAVKKAWRLLRGVIGDDDKFFTLKTQKHPIEVTGSNGGRYFLYPTGCLARIDVNKPFVGRVTAYRDMPLPDQLAAIYVWITQREEDVKSLWGCGNIDLSYRGDRLVTPEGLDAPNMHDITHMPFNSDTHPIIRVEDDYVNFTGCSFGSSGSMGVSLTAEMVANSQINLGDFVTMNGNKIATITDNDASEIIGMALQRAEKGENVLVRVNGFVDSVKMEVEKQDGDS